MAWKPPLPNVGVNSSVRLLEEVRIGFMPRAETSAVVREQVAPGCARGECVSIDEKLNTARQHPGHTALMRPNELLSTARQVADSTE